MNTNTIQMQNTEHTNKDAPVDDFGDFLKCWIPSSKLATALRATLVKSREKRPR